VTEDNDIKSLLIDGIPITDPSRIAAKFNDYFTDIAHSLAKLIPTTTSSFEQFMSPSQVGSFGLIEISPADVLRLSSSIKLTHTAGVDDIDPSIASPSLPIIANTLAEIINCSFNSGIFPQALKIAKVVPIFKKGSREEVSNYRPISILPFFQSSLRKPCMNALPTISLPLKSSFPPNMGFRLATPPLCLSSVCKIKSLPLWIIMSTR
jgi:hypothetical protein